MVRSIEPHQNIKLKKSIKEDFLNKEYKDHNSYPFDARHIGDQDLIIHSMDDSTYSHQTAKGLITYFKTYFFGFYYSGIEVSTSLMPLKKGENGSWEITTEATEDNTRVCEILRIPYRNIVTYDLEGDEFYQCPHVYCKFSEGGKPWESVIYREYSESTYMVELDIQKRVKEQD